MNGSKLIIPPAAAAARAKAKMDATVHAKRCGNCEFGVQSDLAPDNIRCEGLPPFPLILGARETPHGVEPNIVLFRPDLPKSLKGCALWASTAVASLHDARADQ